MISVNHTRPRDTPIEPAATITAARIAAPSINDARPTTISLLPI